MLSKTHLVCGMAASLLFIQPQTPKELAVAVIGGALGGSVPDIDTVKSRTNIDSIITQSAAFIIAAAAIFCDSYFELGILRYLRNHPESLITGGVFYIALMIIGFYSDHRSFTHSILGLFLFSTAVGILYPQIAGAYILGYGSHIGLDLLNRKKVKLLYPLKKGFCLRLCYSDRKANHWLFLLGTIVTASSICYSIVQYIR